jgi:signal transduction histidine kinase
MIGRARAVVPPDWRTPTALVPLALMPRAVAPPRRGPGFEGEAFFELGRNGQFVLDEDQRIRRVNPAGTRLLARSEASLVGHVFWEFVGATSVSGLAQTFLSAGTPGAVSAPCRIEGTAAPGSAAPRWEAVVARLPTGGDPGYLLILADVSGEDALVHALAERGAQLARSNRDLQEFTYIASHDLQEPLRMISSYTQLLQRRYQGKFDKEADEFLAFAQEGATRLQKLLDDLVVYSRVDTRGRAFETVRMEQCLTEALANLRGAIEREKATVDHDPLPEVTGDAAQFTQLFQNLIGNAIKFHGTEVPKVVVRAEDQGTHVRFCVADNGIGIPPEYREKVFEIFQRLNTREEYAGTGVGLAICKRVVERHGGTIWIEGSSPHGTVIYFRLPKSQEPRTPARVDASSAPGTEGARRQAEVLIAERLKELV